MIENIRLSFQGIWAHKMRSFLTMLGIIIGIASIISIVSTIKGTNEQIKQNLIGAGNNVTKIQLYHSSDGSYQYQIAYEGIPDGIAPITDEVFEAIQNVPDVVSAAAYNARQNGDTSFFYGNASLSGTPTFGVDNDYFKTCGYRIKKGRMFVPNDEDQHRPVVILDENAARSLFQGEDPIGKTIECNSIALTVVGIVEQEVKFEPVINSPEDYWTYANSQNSSAVFLPAALWPSLFAYDEPQEVAVQVSYTEAMSTAGKAVADLLNTYNSNQNGIIYKAEDTLEQAKELQDLSNATNQQLVWIASISLLVGGIGVMNIMLVSVTERTREIGLKKAIGAKKSRILWQFLTEAAVLTSLGGVLGVGTGIGLAEIISRMAETPVAISVPAIIFGVVFSMIIGIIFGLIPSIKAANLNPIDALRHE